MGESEAARQQSIRFKIAQEGAFSYRNNNGATPAKCKHCGTKSVPIRYGLANESTKMNKILKSSDLILAIPRVITPMMVGKTILQFGSIECKPEGWQYTGTEREVGQANWLRQIKRNGGYATFSTGEFNLHDIFSDYSPHYIP